MLTGQGAQEFAVQSGFHLDGPPTQVLHSSHYLPLRIIITVMIIMNIFYCAHSL